MQVAWDTAKPNLVKKTDPIEIPSDENLPLSTENKIRTFLGMDKTNQDVYDENTGVRYIYTKRKAAGR